VKIGHQFSIVEIWKKNILSKKLYFKVIPYIQQPSTSRWCLIERFRMTQAHLGRRPPPNIPLSEEINNPRIDGITRSEAIKAMHFYSVLRYIFRYEKIRNVRSRHHRHVYTSISVVCQSHSLWRTRRRGGCRVGAGGNERGR